MFNNPYKNISKVTQNRKVYFQADTPQEIWADVLEHDKESMQELCSAMSKLVYEVGVPKFFVHLSAKILYNLVYRWWGHYTKESDYLASECSNMSASLMAFLQRQYTLAHMGCSVVMVWDEKNEEMLCFRSLDWRGADDIARSTRILSFVNKEDKEIAQIAGITAMVGVLTGAKKGFSVAINYAPWKRSAKFKSDPTFLIRQLLEDEKINTYKEAIKKVSSWKIGSPCFISLCGVKKGDACVIELGNAGEIYIREIGDENFIIQTNHYDLQGSPFTQHNEEVYKEQMNEKQWYESELLRNSQKRQALMQEELLKDSDEEMKDRLISLYKQVPILNWETAQWVIMQPKNGEIEVYASIDK
ncbi:MAG: hypothetical protein COA44_06490 [Arcobacter sp.]|nr:MAG: hypothetical protein COA44_06490 [Arcobacter sp.]